jgi:enoyl-CoA hydratase
MLLSGRWLTAAEALKMKLVNRVVARVDLLPEAEEMAQKIKSHRPLAVSCIKRAVTQGLDLTLQEGLELEARLGSQLTATNKSS